MRILLKEQQPFIITTTTDAVDDHYTTKEDTEINIAVRDNDKDPSGIIADVKSVTQPTNGRAVINADNTIKYIPSNNYNGSDSFTYTNEDGYTATVYIEVTPVEDPTILDNDNIILYQDTEIDIDVLANDIDGDGAPPPVASITQPLHGTATINPDNTLHYVPNPGYSGTDYFTYTNTEGDSAYVNIDVLYVFDGTVLLDDLVYLDEDTEIDIDVLANDEHTDNTKDPSPVISLSNPSHGTATINSDGTIKYVPEPNYNGSDTFTYTNTEGTNAHVNLVIYPTPELTVAVDDTVSTTYNTPVEIDVLSNDTDDDSDKAGVYSVTQPTHGTSEIVTPSIIKYSPELNYEGNDAFSYTNTDGNTSDVKVTINPPVYVTYGGGESVNTLYFISG